MGEERDWGWGMHKPIDPDSLVKFETTTKGALRSQLLGIGYKYKPYGDYMRIEWQPQAMAGGIHLPEMLQQRTMGALDWRLTTVIETGNDCKLAEPGDKILVAPEGVIKAKHNGLEVYFTKESVILGVVEEGKADE